MDALTVPGVLKRSAAVIVGAVLAAILIGGGPAVAAAPSAPPDDVTAAFSDDALQALKRMNAEEFADKDSGAPDLSRISGFGDAHQVHQWSETLLLKADVSDPVIALEEWVAPILDERGGAVGVYRVWRPAPGSAAEYAGYDSDAEAAGALARLDPSTTLVSDPSIGAWYGLQDGTLSALNKLGQVELPYPEQLDAIAPIISERHDEMLRQSAGHEDSAGGSTVIDRRPWFYDLDPWALGIAGILLASGVAGIVYFSRKARA